MSEVTKIQPNIIKQFKAVETPTIKSENEIFKEDNIGVIIQKGALENINLSSVPSIIQTAIDQMALSVESKVLANALLLQIQRDINNLGDAIVEKSYIDGQVSYLTSIINQKSDLGNVANIVDTRLAIVTENLATANQVSVLNSRVGNSETNISNLNQTINTKDSARATQINEVKASVNQSLSHYTDAIGLTVNPDGSVSSSKIEQLKVENENLNISIEETNQAIINKDNEWNAKSIKLITSPSGAITGYSFQNGSGLKATFEINADNFKIANSYNTYTPFSIIGTSLFFNGKVAFSSVTGTDNLISLETLQNAIQNNVVTIDGGKIYANQALVNSLNAQGGIVASTISANEISGKTFIGSTINGAVINGAVVKASYLDLDGELEVLTNYHISVATYNSNPSYYSDAVYISGSNEYRIPSISNILNSISKVQQISESNPTWRNIPLSGGIYSYNISNVGNNNKCVKIRPRFNILTEILIMDTDIRAGGGEPNDLTVDFCYIKVCGVNYARVYQYYLTSGWWYIKIADSLTGTVYTSSVLRWDSGDSQWTAPYTFSATVSSGLVIKVTVQSVSHWEIYLEACSVQVQHDYTSGELVSMDYLNRNYSVYDDLGFLKQAYTIVKEVANTISVNNMI